LANPCWSKVPEERPTVNHMLTAIEKLVKEGTMRE
jgi:hypothetical protein